MSTTETTSAPKDPAATAEQVRRVLSHRHVCPYCGHQQTGGGEACPRCTMEDSPATRQATKARIGPWYVLQTRNPSAPGMKYSTLMSLLRKGYITPKSVVRGPTTHQLWRFAAHVRGVSREFGLCYSCGGSIVRTAAACPSCQRSQEPPGDPDALLEPRHNGVAPVQPAVAPALEPVAAPQAVVSPAPLEIVPPRAIQPADGGSYARRLRALNHKMEAEKDSDAPRETLPAKRAGGPVFGGGEVVSAMGLARALRDNPPKEMLVPSRRGLKLSVALVVLLIGSAAAALYARPDWRNRTVVFLEGTWSRVEKAMQPSAPVRSTPTPPPQAPLDQPLAGRQETEEPQAIVAASTPDAAGGQSEALSSSPAVSRESSVDKARSLWRQGLDAEAEQDFATAVKLYEQITQLPPEDWPGGLKVRLGLVREKAQSTSAR